MGWKHLISAATAAAALALAGSAQAACYADYKAKRDAPLRLHYGVMQVEAQPCTMSDAVREDIQRRLQRGGWVLLSVQSTFGDDGLNNRKDDAGEFYLRF